MPCDTTIVVPTFNEGGNVAELVTQLRAAFTGRSAEVLFVDDSTDDTPAIIAALPAGAMPVRLLHRAIGERHGGLSGAVAAGLASAEGRYVVVMDGDLQHPPELAPQLRDALVEQDVDVAVASRYCAHGSNGGLAGNWRRTASTLSTLLTRALFPQRVGARCSDPMTGFFCVRRDAVLLERLQPRGFKILLEILASHPLRVTETPFTFGERFSGDSKASWRNGLAFLVQLLALRANRATRFAAVGVLGFLVNLLAMASLLALGASYVLASLVATEVAILHNFGLQERFVFRSAVTGGSRRGRLQRFLHCLLVNNADSMLRVPILVLLVERGGLHSLVAQSLTLAVSFAGRFAYTSRVVYRAPLGGDRRRRPSMPRAAESSFRRNAPRPAAHLREGAEA